MKTTIYTCDRCGKESTVKLNECVTVHSRLDSVHNINLASGDNFTDLCAECGAYLYENLETVFNEWVKSSPKDKSTIHDTKKADNLKLLVDTLAKDFIGKAARVRATGTEYNNTKIYIEGYFDEKTLINMASSILTIIEGA